MQDNKQRLNRVMGRLSGLTDSEWNEDKLCEAHDILLHEYGWIPLEEFRMIPIPTFFSMLENINKRYEQQRKAMTKNGRKH